VGTFISPFFGFCVWLKWSCSFITDWRMHCETLLAWRLVMSLLSTTMKRWISWFKMCLYCPVFTVSHWSWNLCLLQIYELRVMETKPDKAVSIIECDMNVRPSLLIQLKANYSVAFANSVFCRDSVFQVDFDAPLGYKEPERRPQHQEEPTVRTKPWKSLHNLCSKQCVKTCLLAGGRGRPQ